MSAIACVSVPGAVIRGRRCKMPGTHGAACPRKQKALAKHRAKRYCAEKQVVVFPSQHWKGAWG
eukprot:524799-Prorocentrum_lima.AAC.1